MNCVEEWLHDVSQTRSIQSLPILQAMPQTQSDGDRQTGAKKSLPAFTPGGFYTI